MNPDGTIHATCVAIDGRGVLLTGRSGSGKSDLALRLIDRGARLVSDDYTVLRVEGGRLIASAPPTIAGRIEMRGVGIVAEAAVAEAEVALVVELDGTVERMPEGRFTAVREIRMTTIALAAFEASTPLKVERAVSSCARSGLKA